MPNPPSDAHRDELERLGRQLGLDDLANTLEKLEAQLSNWLADLERKVRYQANEIDRLKSQIADLEPPR